jgi:glycosyltransferase involved in cell wall biosynthesis
MRWRTTILCCAAESAEREFTVIDPQRALDFDGPGKRGGSPVDRTCKVSVVIPNYNHGKFLPRCLAAIEAQTQQPYEVLLIDDASTDDSLEVIARYAACLPRFQLIRHHTNLGVIAGMNEGLRLASGTHVLFAAADDWIEPDLIGEALRWLERYPDAGLWSALSWLADENGVVTGAFRTPLPRWTAGYISPAQALRQLARDDTWFNGNTTIVNRAAAIAAGGYRRELASFCDGFLNANLAWRHGACFIPRFLAVWQRLETGYAASVTVDPDALLRIFNAIQELDKNAPQTIPQDYLRRWQARWRFTAARAALVLRTESGCERVLSILPAQLRTPAKLLVLFARIPGIGFWVATLLLFLLLRFQDLVPVIQRRLEWIVLGGLLNSRG